MALRICLREALVLCLLFAARPATATSYTVSELGKDLNALIPADSGWVLHVATAINDAGEIVGRGDFGGNTRAFLLKPIAGCG